MLYETLESHPKSRNRLFIMLLMMPFFLETCNVNAQL